MNSKKHYEGDLLFLSGGISSPVLVALSGGADSTALLHLAAMKYPGQVSAVHINHNLQEASVDFQHHSQMLCDSLGIPLTILSVCADKRPGQSPEDAARIARYTAIERFAKEPDADGVFRAKTVLLGHHADDQVETIILAMSRGAGLKGLSGMATHFERGGVNWARPLMSESSSRIKSWLLSNNIPWIEDPTNATDDYTRNKIRHKLIPVLEELFPEFRKTFSRSAANCAQSQALLYELLNNKVKVSADGGVLLSDMRGLSQDCLAGAIRHWLELCGTQASHAQLLELMKQITACGNKARKINIKIGSGFVIRRGDFLVFTC